jgi:hypothetical protein
MNNREMPIGIQDFEKLREEKYLYVAKTDFVYSLAKKSAPYFLTSKKIGLSIPSFIST